MKWFLVSLLLIPSVAAAQTEDTLRISPLAWLGGAAVGLNTYLGTVDLAAEPEIGAGVCGTLRSGSEFAETFSAGMEYRLGDSYDLGFRVSRQNLDGHLASDAGGSDRRLSDGSLVPVLTTYAMRYEARAWRAELGATNRRLAAPFELFAFGGVAIPDNISWSFAEEIDDAALRFPDGSDRLLFSQGTSNVVIIPGFELGIRYPLAMSDRMELLPEFGLGGLLGPGRPSGISPLTLTSRLGIGFRYRNVSRPTPPPPPTIPPLAPNLPPDPLTPPVDPEVWVEVNGQGSSAEPYEFPVEVVEWLSIERTTLLPFIFFEEGSSTTTAGPLLNLVASRAATEAGEIIVRGFRDRSEQPEVAQQRANEVAEILVRLGLAKDRLRIVDGGVADPPSNPAYPEGRAENRRVEIAGNSQIVRPIERVDTLTGISAPPIRLMIRARDAVVAEWRVDVAIEGDPIRTLRGSGTSLTPIPLELTERELVRVALDRERLSIRARIVTPDLSEIESEERLLRPTIRRRTSELPLRAGIAIPEILFAFNSAQLDSEDSTLIARIARLAGPDLAFRVIGGADDLGDPAYNRRLALRRAEAVAKVLGEERAEIEVREDADRLFEAPEDRFRARSVRIELIPGEENWPESGSDQE